MHAELRGLGVHQIRRRHEASIAQSTARRRRTVQVGTTRPVPMRQAGSHEGSPHRRARQQVRHQPDQGLWAGRIAPWGVVHHVGRKSNRQYETPVLAFVDAGRISIALNYGADADWVKNVVAAGEFSLVRGGKTMQVAGVRVLPSDSPTWSSRRGSPRCSPNRSSTVVSWSSRDACGGRAVRLHAR